MNIDKNKVELYVNSTVRKYSNRGISDEELFNVGMQAALKVIDENKNNPNFDMLKDYRWNNPWLKNIKNNDLIYQLECYQSENK